jgi:mono/diheme cytochrome c family protein
MALVPLLAALPGCGGDSYPDALDYPLRTDPIPVELGGNEYLEPDRPGQLPLTSLNEIEDVRNPFYPLYLDKSKKPFIDPTQLPAADQNELRETLDELFGTPAHPKVELISAETRQILQLDEPTLTEGSRLYRQYCLQCHGLTGDGHGPTAKWVNPHPRDYRPGIFKFQSVDQADDDKFFPKRPDAPPSDDSVRPPRRDDLLRTLMEGVEGTAMQSYNMLPENELNAIISYIIHLSIRGEAEEQFLRATADRAKGNFNVKEALEGRSITSFLKGKRNSGGKVRDIVDKWRDAQDEFRKIRVGTYKFKEPSDPSRTPEEVEAFYKSVRNGQDIFLGRGPVSGGCTQCHYDYGRKAMYKFDQWGTMVRPRDLTKGSYRGGRRPVDLYYRIQSGINGSGMLKQGGQLTPDQIWDLVNFVRIMPYPAMRKDSKLQPPLD